MIARNAVEQQDERNQNDQRDSRGRNGSRTLVDCQKQKNARQSRCINPNEPLGGQPPPRPIKLLKQQERRDTGHKTNELTDNNDKEFGPAIRFGKKDASANEGQSIRRCKEPEPQ